MSFYLQFILDYAMMNLIEESDDMPKVSVIMPVYNSEEYLDKAIMSVINQSYKDFELILVDDGSKDKSGKICDKYARKYSNVVVIHKKNGGLCSARNAGLKKATGKYISFIDNDDEYLPGFLEDNVRIMEEKKVDWVRFNRISKTFFADGTIKESRHGTTGFAKNGEVTTITHKQIKNSFEKMRLSGALYGIWDALFKTSIIKKNNIQFDTDIKMGGEDWVFNLQYLKYVKKMAFNGNSYYLYYRRFSHSVSTKFDDNRVLGLLKSYETEKETLKKLNMYNDKQKILSFGDCFINILEILNSENCHLKFKEKIKYIRPIREDKNFQIYFESNDFKSIKDRGRVRAIIIKKFYYRRFFSCILINDLYRKILRKRTI